MYKRILSLTVASDEIAKAMQYPLETKQRVMKINMNTDQMIAVAKVFLLFGKFLFVFLFRLHVFAEF